MKSLLSILLYVGMLFAVPSALAEHETDTMQSVLGNDEAWGEFDAIWREAFSGALDMHPYYRLNLSYFITLTEAEHQQQAQYIEGALAL